MTLIERRTRETRIKVEVNDGAGETSVRTGDTFLDHMMFTLARYAGVSMTLEASGDMKHHLIEDVAIAVGEAFAESTPAECARYGERVIPMDDALVQAVVDVGGRAYYEGELPSGLYTHWMRSFADQARTTLHVRVLRGTDAHHVVEAAFKALGLALRDARAASDGVFSTKGRVDWGGRSAPPRSPSDLAEDL